MLTNCKFDMNQICISHYILEKSTNLIKLIALFDRSFSFSSPSSPPGRDATFTCVVNNLGGYRVSGDAASARVGIGLFNMV